jgi:choline-sulfatase
VDRRRFLSGTVNALGALGLGAKRLAAEETARAESEELPKQRERPNVLVVMSDQHKRSCMGVAGDEVAVTPHLDQLASESLRFTNAYCTNPVCGPSRASIMTGLYARHLENKDGGMPYSHRHKSMANHFSRAGYLTALIGKMHFLDAQSHGFDYELQFNDWLQYLGPRAQMYADEMGRQGSGAGFPQIPDLWQPQHDPWKELRKPDGRLGGVAVGRASEMEEADHFDSFVARESIRFLENYTHENEPFFLVTSFLKPHDPFMPAKRFAAMFEAEKMKLPETWGKADLEHLPQTVRRSIESDPYTPELKDAAAARQRMASYYGSLAQMDDCAGQVLAALKRLGLDRNTIVLYTSDHGEMLGDLGLWNKFQFYEGSCGVPLLVKMPGVAARVCEEPVSLISLVATLAELCAVSVPGPVDGKSFAELIVPANSGFAYGPVFAEFNVGEKWEKFMIREGSYKYTHWTHDIAELYDLKTDPQELHNLAELPEHRQTAEDLKVKLMAWLSKGPGES